MGDGTVRARAATPGVGHRRHRAGPRRAGTAPQSSSRAPAGLHRPRQAHPHRTGRGDRRGRPARRSRRGPARLRRVRCGGPRFRGNRNGTGPLRGEPVAGTLLPALHPPRRARRRHLRRIRGGPLARHVAPAPADVAGTVRQRRAAGPGGRRDLHRGNRGRCHPGPAPAQSPRPVRRRVAGGHAHRRTPSRRRRGGRRARCPHRPREPCDGAHRSSRRTHRAGGRATGPGPESGCAGTRHRRLRHAAVAGDRARRRPARVPAHRHDGLRHRDRPRHRRRDHRPDPGTPGRRRGSRGTDVPAAAHRRRARRQGGLPRDSRPPPAPPHTSGTCPATPCAADSPSPHPNRTTSRAISTTRGGRKGNAHSCCSCSTTPPTPTVCAPTVACSTC